MFLVNLSAKTTCSLAVPLSFSQNNQCHRRLVPAHPANRPRVSMTTAGTVPALWRPRHRRGGPPPAIGGMPRSGSRSRSRTLQPRASPAAADGGGAVGVPPAPGHSAEVVLQGGGRKAKQAVGGWRPHGGMEATSNGAVCHGVGLAARGGLRWGVGSVLVGGGAAGAGRMWVVRGGGGGGAGGGGGQGGGGWSWGKARCTCGGERGNAVLL